MKIKILVHDKIEYLFKEKRKRNKYLIQDYEKLHKILKFHEFKN